MRNNIKMDLNLCRTAKGDLNPHVMDLPARLLNVDGAYISHDARKEKIKEIKCENVN